jgi:hypothetical protein
MLPYRQLHLIPEVFGQDVHTFRPERFLVNDDKTNLSRNAHFRPWAGGTTLCSFRKIPGQERDFCIRCRGDQKV